MKIAAIDIGSNAARMQISSVLHDNNKVTFKKVEYVRFALRLGHDVFNDGIITETSINNLKKLMLCYRILFELHEVEHYMICATSAMREAKNGADVVQQIYDSLGMKIELIGGTKEAELINNVVVQVLEPEKTYLHIDVGGGSTELNLYQNRKKIASKSFKIGSVRLLEGKASPEAWQKMQSWIADNFPDKQEIIAIGTGGNISKLFNLVAKTGEISTNIAEIIRMKTYIADFSLEERINKLKLNEDRADVIVPAAEIYIYVMQAIGATDILVPDLGLKDGILQLVYEQAISVVSKQ